MPPLNLVVTPLIRRKGQGMHLSYHNHLGWAWYEECTFPIDKENTIMPPLVSHPHPSEQAIIVGCV